MYCANCGNKVSDKAQFCPECGTNIEIKTQSDPPSKIESSKGFNINKVKECVLKNKKFLFIIVAVILCVFIYLEFFSSSSAINGAWQYQDGSDIVMMDIKSGSKVNMSTTLSHDDISTSIKGKLRKENGSYFLNIFDSEVTMTIPLKGYTKEVILANLVDSDYKTEIYNYIFNNSEVKNGNMQFSFNLSELPPTVREFITDEMDSIDAEGTFIFTPMNKNILQARISGMDISDSITFIKK